MTTCCNYWKPLQCAMCILLATVFYKRSTVFIMPAINFFHTNVRMAHDSTIYEHVSVTHWYGIHSPLRHIHIELCKLPSSLLKPSLVSKHWTCGSPELFCFKKYNNTTTYSRHKYTFTTSCKTTSGISSPVHGHVRGNDFYSTMFWKVKITQSLLASLKKRINNSCSNNEAKRVCITMKGLVTLRCEILYGHTYFIFNTC